MKRVVVAGHICLDIIPEIDHPITLDPGRLFEVGAPTIATGGAVSNTGVALHLLGLPTTLMGKVGDDSFGRSILEVLNGYDPALARGMVIVPGETSSYTVVVNIPGTDRIFLHCPGANNSFVASDLDLGALDGASLFHFGYPAFMAGQYANGGAECAAMFSTVHKLGITTSLDLGMPDPGGPGGQANWPEIFAKVLPHVDVFMPSADELLYCLGREQFGSGDSLQPDALRPLADQLLEFGNAVVAIKMGARGMYLRTAGVERLAAMGLGAPADPENWANRELWFPIYQEEKFVGATGAGDTTIAGFLAALLRGLPIEKAGGFANAVGACNVEAPDALGGIRGWDETNARIEAGWKTVSPELETPGWTCGDAGILASAGDGCE